MSHPAIKRLFLWQNDDVFVHPLFLSQVIMKSSLAGIVFPPQFPNARRTENESKGVFHRI